MDQSHFTNIRSAHQQQPALRDLHLRANTTIQLWKFAEPISSPATTLTILYSPPHPLAFPSPLIHIVKYLPTTTSDSDGRQGLSTRL